MRVEEIALRQEIRQMMTEAGINKNTIRDIAKQVLREEIEKQVKVMLNQINEKEIIRSTLSAYDFREIVRNVLADEVRNAVKISIDVKAEQANTNK